MSALLKTVLGACAAAAFGSVAAVELFQSMGPEARANPPRGPAQTTAAAAQPGGGSTITLQSTRGGHFVSEIRINGSPVQALVDTGATLVALSHEDAERANIRPSGNARTGMANTANGQVKFTMVMLNEVRLGPLVLRDVEAAVMPKGAMQNTLLGMAFLKRLSRFEMRDSRLILTQ